MKNKKKWKKPYRKPEINEIKFMGMAQYTRTDTNSSVLSSQTTTFTATRAASSGFRTF